MLLLLTALVAAAEPTAAKPAEPDNDPVVCEKRGEAPVGTRLKSKRICMRKSEWKYVEAHTQREMNRLNSRETNPGMAGGR